MDTPEGRRVLIGKKGEDHSLSILPEHFDARPVGPNGETYKALGYELIAWEDDRSPYVAPKRAVPRAVEKDG